MFYPCFYSEKDFNQKILEHNLNLIVVVITQGARAWRLPLYPPFSLVDAVTMMVILIPPLPPLPSTFASK